MYTQNWDMDNLQDNFPGRDSLCNFRRKYGCNLKDIGPPALRSHSHEDIRNTLRGPDSRTQQSLDRFQGHYKIWYTGMDSLLEIKLSAIYKVSITKFSLFLV